MFQQNFANKSRQLTRLGFCAIVCRSLPWGNGSVNYLTVVTVRNISCTVVTKNPGISVALFTTVYFLLVLSVQWELAGYFYSFQRLKSWGRWGLHLDMCSHAAKEGEGVSSWTVLKASTWRWHVGWLKQVLWPYPTSKQMVMQPHDEPRRERHGLFVNSSRNVSRKITDKTYMSKTGWKHTWELLRLKLEWDGQSRNRLRGLQKSHRW